MGILLAATATAVLVSCAPDSAGAARVSTSTSTGSVPVSRPGNDPSLGSTVLASTLLSDIPVTKEQPAHYDRALFPHWLDVDGDGCDSRNQVLRRDSRTPAQVDPIGCVVIAGDWRSPYDDTDIDSPGDVDIDHVVPLKEAWDSGAYKWDSNRRLAYANDTTDNRTLRAESVAINRSKGEKDPSNWLPPRRSTWCRYLGDWIAIKARWGLSMDQSEAGRIRKLLRSDCPDLVIASWSPVDRLPAVVTPPRTTSPTGTDGPLYANCAAARAAGAAPLLRGQPGYRPELDGDHDGVACE